MAQLNEFAWGTLYNVVNLLVDVKERTEFVNK